MKNLFKKMYNSPSKSKIWKILCFGALLLVGWNEIGSNVRLIIATLNGGMAKIIDSNSPNWCEQSIYSMVQCHKYMIYTEIPVIIMASLLYCKHKKVAFLCLILLPLFSLLVAKMLSER